MTPSPKDIARAAGIIGESLAEFARAHGNRSAPTTYDEVARRVLTAYLAALAERGVQVMEWRPITEAEFDGKYHVVWNAKAKHPESIILYSNSNAGLCQEMGYTLHVALLPPKEDTRKQDASGR